jgi:uroporphyrinogen-III synthase
MSLPEPSAAGVLITRPEPGASETAARVAALGWQPVLAPVLAITPRPIGEVGPMQAVLVTSGNAVPALAALPRGLRLLAVGDATAARARAAGFSDVHSAGRDAAALAELAGRLCRPDAGELLLVSGEGRGRPLAEALRAAGFTVQHRVAYAAAPVAALPPAAVGALRSGAVRVALFFSPESARAWVWLLQRDELTGMLEQVEALALSPATAQALAPLPWRHIRVASQPTQDDLLTLMSTPDATDPVIPSQPSSAAAAATTGVEIPAPPATSRPPQPPAAPVGERHSAMPVLAALGFLVLLAGMIIIAWRLIGLSEQITALPPPPDPARLDAMTARVGALEQLVATLAARPTPDLAGLEARLAAVEARRPPPVPDTAPLAEKLDSVAAQAAAAKGAEASMSDRLGTLEQRLAAAEQDEQKLAGRTAQAQTLARAQVALDAGEPLGDLPGAPPPLLRFAHAAPPTEAALRLAFPAAADAAERASRPSTQGKSFGERMWLRAESLVKVKEGDRVVIGAPAAEVLAAAEAKLQAGDLAGALTVLDGLDGPAAQAMAAWRERAQALLDARAALAGVARG